MSSDYLDLGSSPCGESCVQVGSNDYHSRARLECQTYRDQLLREFPAIPESCRFAIRSNPHDFGSYLSVVVYYDSASVDYAFHVENNLPESWDSESLAKLKG